MRFIKTILFLTVSTLSATEYTCIDRNFSSYAGAENILFLQKGLEKIEDFVFPVPNITAEDFKKPEECPYFSSKSGWGRYARNLLVWIPINASSVVTQHEVFGHGYRVRDLGPKYAKVVGYEMYVIAGSTHIAITNNLTTSQNLTIAVAGLEADAVLANKIKLKWLSDGQFDPRQTSLYLIASLDLLSYTLTTHGTPKTVPSNGNDISNFIFYLNTTYREGHLSHSKLRNLSIINLADPFIFYSIFAEAVYTKYGLPFPVHLIKIGSIEYMPSIRVALTPFGLQGYFENFFLIRSIPTYVYLKWGKNGPNTYYGLGVENQSVFTWQKIVLGFRFDAWRQPNVLFEQGALSVEQIESLPANASIPELYPTSVLNAQSLGGAFSVIGAYAWTRARLFLEMGYKSTGYLPGEALRQSPILRGGLSGQF